MMHPKQPRLENPHLLLMARNVARPCLLRVPGVCLSGMSDVSCCACHGNSGSFNKGSGMKAHDFFSVWGCARCHTWLDESYIASGEERQGAFLRALPRQIVEWSKINAAIAGTKPADRAATGWALTNLEQRGYAFRDKNGVYLPLEKVT